MHPYYCGRATLPYWKIYGIKTARISKFRNGVHTYRIYELRNGINIFSSLYPLAYDVPGTTTAAAVGEEVQGNRKEGAGREGG